MTKNIALSRLHLWQPYLTTQQYKTLKGQILAGDIEGAMIGLDKLMGVPMDEQQEIGSSERSFYAT